MARLPPELTDIIIALLSSDPESLRACSLVCKDWLPASRRYSFPAITLEQSTPRTRALVELLTTPLSTIAKHVRTVTISASQPLSIMARPLEHLVGVETLTIRGRWGPIQEWDLERLSMWFSRIITLDMWVEYFNSANEFFGFLSLFRSLRVLHLRGGYGLRIGQRDDQHTLTFPSSLRVINIHLDKGLGFFWLIPPHVESSALSEVRLTDVGVQHLQWLHRLLESCGPSIQLLDISLLCQNQDELRLLRERLDLARFSRLQVLRIDGITPLYHFDIEHLPDLVSQIASEHMIKITLRLRFFSGKIDEGLKMIDWMRLAHTLSHPRFSRLRRVEIDVWVFINATKSQRDEWVSRIRTDMRVLDSRDCLFVSTL